MQEDRHEACMHAPLSLRCKQESCIWFLILLLEPDHAVARAACGIATCGLSTPGVFWAHTAVCPGHSLQSNGCCQSQLCKHAHEVAAPTRVQFARQIHPAKSSVNTDLHDM
jgi:hypothetical protein